jgi:hypothetical protein
MTDENDNGGPPPPGDAAEYIADLAEQLAAVASAAGLMQTASVLMRAQLSALADLRRLQFEKAAPEDAA